MASLKFILQEIEETIEIKSIITAYEEIASMKMRKIRENVLGNRGLIMDLVEIYKQLLVSYKNQILRLMEEKKIKSKGLSLRQHNKKTACVFISADSGLFGAILKKTYEAFADYITKNNFDPIIIGEFGKKRFMRQFPDRKFIFFNISGRENREDVDNKMIEDFTNYENIIIFYPRFESMESQKVALLDVSDQEKALIDQESAHAYYYFEPSFEKILTFFEKEIFGNILGQTLIESDLARYASRMITLDTTSGIIDSRLKAIELQKKLAIHRIMNKKQLESITGISLWKLV